MADDSSEIVKEAAESVSFENVKTGGGASSFYAAMQMSDSVAHARSMSLARERQNDAANIMQQKMLESLIATSPTEGGVDVSALGQLMKALQMTPPPTDIPTQGQ